MKNRRGFTLIELMVALGIVAVVSTTGFTTYTKTQVTTRDDRRISDLRMIAAALDLYYQANKHYPYSDSSDNPGNKILMSFAATGTNNLYLGPPGGPDWLPELDPYISKVPVDPINNQSNLYFYYSVDIGYVGTDGIQYSCTATDGVTPVDGKYMVPGQFYELSTFLENANNPNSNKNKNYAWCDGKTKQSASWPWPNYFRIQNGWSPDTCPAGETSCS